MEEGEIDTYAVISRPEVYLPSAEVGKKLEELNSYSENSDNDSDSSDSNMLIPKKAKVEQPKHPLPVTNTSQGHQKKKWDIWSTPLQEQILIENLGSCDVHLDRSKNDRNVEAYNYKRKFSNDDLEQDIFSGKSSYNEDDDNSEEKWHKRKFGKKYQKGRKNKNNCKPLSKLDVSLASDPKMVAKTITKALKEEKEYLIEKVVDVLGAKRAIELYNRTSDIEADGGMMVMNQSRRRTPGGVFLKLVHDEHINEVCIKEIFNSEHKATNIRRKKLIATKRRNRTQAVKEDLLKSGLLNNDLSELLVKTELKDEMKAETFEDKTEINDEQTLTNPPPSPATDQDTPPQPREQQFLTFSDQDDDDDDDYLEIETEMDLL
uniref:Phosphorylated adapter RNA export protein n=2 Tax=Clastoptera arizonana TaxID=38151 RepID=A0A1B6DZQ4_9HEMI